MLILLIEARGSRELRVEECGMLLLSMGRCSSWASPEEPDPPESLVVAWGRSITLGLLRSSSSFPCENLTARGDTSTLIASKGVPYRRGLRAQGKLLLASMLAHGGNRESEQGSETQNSRPFWDNPR